MGYTTRGIDPKRMTKKDIQEKVTNQVIAGLRRGDIAWIQPWESVTPQNWITKHHYQGANVLLAKLATSDGGYRAPLFAGYSQIKNAGGHVLKGQRGQIIIYFKLINIERDVENTEGEIHRENEQIPMLRYLTVFNIDQTSFKDDLNVQEYEHIPDTTADELLNRHKPKIEHGLQHACFKPAIDKIELPAKTAFKSSNQYYLTAFHELTHWTGHSARLNRWRKQRMAFGSERYSREELIAEIGANFLNCFVGIQASVKKNSQAYINNWIAVLQGNSNLILEAASKAQQSMDYITSDPSK